MVHTLLMLLAHTRFHAYSVLRKFGKSCLDQLWTPPVFGDES